MSLTFFNQWLQWVYTGKWNWSEFDLINISFESDRVAGDWRVTIALFGIGAVFTYMTRAGAEKWEEVMKDGE